MNEKIKLALIGAGERGQYCYAPYAILHGYEVEFVAVAEPHRGRREKFAADYHVPAAGVFETGRRKKDRKDERGGSGEAPRKEGDDGRDA